MINARAQGESKWYSPERDMAYTFPDMLRRALFSLKDWDDDKYKAHHVSRDAFAQDARELGKLTVRCLNCEIEEAELRKELRRFNPNFKAVVGEQLLWVMFGRFHGWARQLHPKTSSDVKIDSVGLDELDERFLESE